MWHSNKASMDNNKLVCICDKNMNHSATTAIMSGGATARSRAARSLHAHPPAL